MTRIPETREPKLTKQQLAVLSKLSAGQGSAYSLRCSLNTLWALQSRDLAQSIPGPGSIAFPRNMGWYITEAGRATLAKAEGRS